MTLLNNGTYRFSRTDDPAVYGLYYRHEGATGNARYVGTVHKSHRGFWHYTLRGEDTCRVAFETRAMAADYMVSAWSPMHSCLA